jgi:D-lactate dehydrogenase (cytochrome)
MHFGVPDPALVADLLAILGDRVSTAEAIRAQHGKDESYHPCLPPDVVAIAHSTEEVAKIAAVCAKHKTPIIPFGTGTSLEGHVAALKGGVCISLREMKRVIELNAEDLDVRVEAGVTRKEINEYLRDTGLFFPVDPGADASLGGMAATRASGTNAVRYGTMRENVLGLTVVLADGRVIHTGGRARKSSAGYDLTRLFVGSEGTLGIITELTLRLFGIPEATSAAVCAFPSVDAAVRAVIATIQSGIPVARIELLDETTVEAVNAYSKLDAKVAPTLFFEFHGTPRSVEEQAAQVGEIAHAEGGSDFQWSTRPEERTRLWQARHNVYYAYRAMAPGCDGLVADVCVPIARLAECVAETRIDLADTWLKSAVVGHVGDGNFHTIFLVDPKQERDLAEAARLSERMVERALAMGGTCTGEHGVGMGKMKYLKAEHGEALEVMKAIKLALDPENRMNPGKMLEVLVP